LAPEELPEPPLLDDTDELPRDPDTDDDEELLRDAADVEDDELRPLEEDVGLVPAEDDCELVVVDRDEERLELEGGFCDWELADALALELEIGLPEDVPPLSSRYLIPNTSSIY
jgi:hypothetical protein